MENLGIEPADGQGISRPPRMPAHRKRTGRLTVPVNQAELERYYNAAAKAEKTLSEWVRYCCEQVIQQRLTRAQK